MIRRAFERLTGYWIYRTRFLPIGADLRVDLARAGIHPRMVFDVGANIGQSYTRFRGYFPNSRIISFEPVSRPYERLARTVAGDNLATAERLALGEKSGREVVSVSDNWTEGNSLLFPSDAPDCHKEAINVDTVDSYCAANAISQIDILKIDTEGFEIPVLRGARLTRTEAVFCEVGFSRNNERHTYLPDVMELLDGMTLHGLYDIVHSQGGEYPSHANALFLR